MMIRRNKDLTHRLFTPMNNIVMPWTTIAEVIKKSLQGKSKQFYLNIQPCRELDSRIYELILPSTREQTHYLIRLVDEKKDLFPPIVAKDDFDREKSLQLLVTVHWSGTDLKDKNTSVTALFRAKQTYEGFYQFKRAHRFKTVDVKEKQKVNRNQAVDKVVDQRRSEFDKQFGLDEEKGPIKMLDQQTFLDRLNCSLNLPQNAVLANKWYQMFELCDGAPVAFPSYEDFKNLMILSRVRGDLNNDESKWKKSSFKKKAWRASFEKVFKVKVQDDDGEVFDWVEGDSPDLVIDMSANYIVVDANEEQRKSFRRLLLDSDLYLTDVPVEDDATERKKNAKLQKSDEYIRQKYNTFIMNTYILLRPVPDPPPDDPTFKRPTTFKDALPLMELHVSEEVQDKQIAAVRYIKERMTDVSTEAVGATSLIGPGLETKRDREFMVDNFVYDSPNLQELYGRLIEDSPHLRESYRELIPKEANMYLSVFNRFWHYAQVYRIIALQGTLNQPQLRSALRTIDKAMKDLYLHAISGQIKGWIEGMTNFYESFRRIGVPALQRLDNHLNEQSAAIDGGLISFYGQLFPACRPAEQPKDIMRAIKKRLLELKPEKYAELLHIRERIFTTVQGYIDGLSKKETEELYNIGLNATLVPDLSEQKALEYLKAHQRLIALGPRAVREPARTEPDPLIAVANFFGRDPPPGVADDTLRLFGTLPWIECLWDWEPRDAVLSQGSEERDQVWVTYARGREITTVIWQKTPGKAELNKQNQVRLLAATQGKGAKIMQAFNFRTEDQRYEGFQTMESRMVDNNDSRLTVSDRITAIYTGTDFLEQMDTKKILAFNFLVDDRRPDLSLAHGQLQWWPSKYKACPSVKDIAESYRACTLDERELNYILNIIMPSPDDMEQHDIEQQEKIKQKREVLTFRLQELPPRQAFYTLFKARIEMFKVLSFPKEGIVWLGLYTFNDAFRNCLCIWERWSSFDMYMVNHPRRKYDKLKKHKRLNLTLEPISCLVNEESALLSLTRWNVDSVPIYGNQYWTICMENKNDDIFYSLGVVIECNHAGVSEGYFDRLVERIVSKLVIMQKNKITHGGLEVNSFISTAVVDSQVWLVDLGFFPNFEPRLDAMLLIASCEKRIRTLKGSERRIVVLKTRYETLINAIKTTFPDATVPDKLLQKQYLTSGHIAETRRLVSEWCEKYGLTIPKRITGDDDISQVQRSALALHLADKREGKKGYPNVVLGVRPAFLANMNAQSCYFTVCMLMLYHMQPIVSTLDCSQKELESEHPLNGKRTDFFARLGPLLELMKKRDILESKDLEGIFTLSQDAFPHSYEAETLGQRDASELMKNIVSCSTNPNMVSLTLKQTEKTSLLTIRNLVCNGEVISAAAQEQFEVLWNEEEGSRQSLFDQYTYDKAADRIIRRKDLDPAIRRANVDPGQRDMDPDLIEWNTLPGVSIEERRDVIMINELPLGDVCTQIEEFIKNERFEDKTALNSEDDMFYAYARTFEIFDTPTSNYILVSFTFDPTLLDVRSCNYGTKALNFGESSYDLMCLGLHSGGVRGGHYVTYLKIKETWYLYDDLNGVRRPVAEIPGNAIPSLLLFRKRTVADHDEDGGEEGGEDEAFRRGEDSDEDGDKGDEGEGDGGRDGGRDGKEAAPVDRREYPDVVNDVRPAYLENALQTSCYFTVFALMMYQMRDPYLLLTLRCEGGTPEEVRLRFLNELNSLLTLMSEVNIVTNNKLIEAFKASRSAFPNKVKNPRAGVAVNQQDPAELMLALLSSCSRPDGDGPDIVSNTIMTTTVKSDVPIRLLMCGKKAVPADVTNAFETRWNERPKGERGLLKNRTLRSGTITDRRGKECAIERGVVDNVRDFGDFDPASGIEWNTLKGTPKRGTQPMITLKYTSPAGAVCQVIEDYIKNNMKNPQTEYDGYNKDNANDLFFFYSRRQVVFQEPTSKYLLVNFAYDPKIAKRKDPYSYKKKNLKFDNSEYELVCVGHHTTGKQNSGHHNASVKIGTTWYQYDDFAKIRKPGAISTNNVPTLLLFIKLPASGDQTPVYDGSRTPLSPPEDDEPRSPFDALSSEDEQGGRESRRAPVSDALRRASRRHDARFPTVPPGVAHVARRAPPSSLLPTPPSEDVVEFFLGKGSVLFTTNEYNAMDETLKLVCVLPHIECLWDWIPIKADLILGKYPDGASVWVLMYQMGSENYSTVVWQKFRKNHTVKQNLHRLIAEAFGEGPKLHSTFITNDLKFEGFQTDVSEPETVTMSSRIKVQQGSMEMILEATEFLLQNDRELAFQFLTSPTPPVNNYGSRSQNEKVWTTKEDKKKNDPCTVGLIAWNIYLQKEVDVLNCGLTRQELFSILKMSFVNASEAQKKLILQSVDKFELEDCTVPRILLNEMSSPSFDRFKFIACGEIGCSVLLRYKEAGKNVMQVSKRMQTCTGPHVDKKTGKEIAPKVWWLLSPHREYEMLELFSKAQVAVEPVQEPVQIKESLAILLIKNEVGYYPPVGEQFWKFDMKPARMTLLAYITCGLLTDATMSDMSQQVLRIFELLHDNKLTHGDFHLNNIMTMPEGKELRLIDCAYSSDTVFMPWYDLLCFTYSCNNNVRGDNMPAAKQARKQAKTLATNVYNELIKRPIYRKTIDVELATKLQEEGEISPQYGMDKMLPKIASRNARSVLFQHVYFKELERNLLVRDGSRWIQELGLEKRFHKTTKVVESVKRMSKFQEEIVASLLEFPVRGSHRRKASS